MWKCFRQYWTKFEMKFIYDLNHSNELNAIGSFSTMWNRLNRMVSLALKSFNFISLTVCNKMMMKRRNHKSTYIEAPTHSHNKQQKCSFRPTQFLFSFHVPFEFTYVRSCLSLLQLARCAYFIYVRFIYECFQL